MSKYTPLTRHLAQRDLDRIPMTFDQIERLLGFSLPPSSRKHRAWWSNNPSNSVMTKAWLEAGYQSEQVDIEKEKLVFARLNAVASDDPAGMPGDHPMFGCMVGMITIAEGTDLTEPAFSDDEMERLIDRRAASLHETRT
jgi:hypothetical protein